MEHLIKRLERLGARLGAAMLTAACVVGLALIIPIYHPQGWKTWADLVFWFVVVAVVIGSVKTLLGLFKK